MRRLPRFQVAFAGVSQRAPPPGGGGGVHPHHVGALVRQQHRGQRAGDVLPEVEHPHAVEGAWHSASSGERGGGVYYAAPPTPARSQPPPRTPGGHPCAR